MWRGDLRKPQGLYEEAPSFRDNYKTCTQILYPEKQGFKKTAFLDQFVLRTLTVALKITLSRYNGDSIKK